MLNRRHFLGAGMAGATALTFSSVWSQNTPQFGLPDLPSVGFKRMKLGTMEIIALNDGALRRRDKSGRRYPASAQGEGVAKPRIKDVNGRHPEKKKDLLR